MVDATSDFEDRWAIAERLFASDRERSILELRDRMLQIAESNSARGRLASGMYAEEQRRACGDELARRANVAWTTFAEVLRASRSLPNGRDIAWLKATLRSLLETERVELTKELHRRLASSSHSVGSDDLLPTLSRVWNSIEPQVDLLFLSCDPKEREKSHGDSPVVATVAETCWGLLHPEIVQVARSRFESGHYADAAEAAMKGVNTRVKDIVFDRVGKELDGATLMYQAFSPNNPVIQLGDASETGRNIQQGYMQIFAGAMTGIRNPKAHGNIEITWKRCLYFLFLASLLLSRLDDSVT